LIGKKAGEGGEPSSAWRPADAALAGWLFACCAFVLGIVLLESPASAVELNRLQQIEILTEATRAFDRAVQRRDTNTAQAAKDFQEAAEKFQLLVDSGVRNGRLYYNLGNAYLETGHLGRAILNYRKAAAFMPNDPRLEHNLGYARSLRRNQIETAGKQAFLHTLFFWHYETSLNARYVTGLVVFVAFWVMMIARLFFRQARWRYALVPTLVIWLALGVSVAVQTWSDARTVEAVVVEDNVVVRKGNGEGFEPQFKQKLHEGVELVVLEQQRGWCHIELPDGKTGWVKTSQIETI
jgi:hypothetical protein